MCVRALISKRDPVDSIHLTSSMAAVRCCGLTKTGQRCSITSLSNILDSAGRRAADPLRKGGAMCMFHMNLFPTKPAHADEPVIAYIDLETNSLDVLTGKIVEIAALIDGSRGMFSTVVHPGHDETPDDAPVHGIPHEELLLGPCFVEAFERLDKFLRYASLSVLESDDDSEDDRFPAASMKPSLEVAVVAHNGAKFDFPFLLSACMRAGVSPTVMAGWIYVDTLDLLRATDRAGECNKLQCAFRAFSAPSCLRAHRALDDCIALEAVIRHVSESFGVTPWTLLRPFACRMDEGTTIAQMSALIGWCPESQPVRPCVPWVSSAYFLCSVVR